MKIAVDAMGGDHAPQAIVEGVALAQQDFPEVEFLLYGKEAEIKKYLTNEKKQFDEKRLHQWSLLHKQ